MSLHAVLNIEGAFALAGLIALAIRTTSVVPVRQASSLPTALLPAIAITAYWRATHFYFLSDDFLLINHARSAISHLPTSFTTPGGDGFYRPIGYAIYGLTSTWAAFDSTRWHWASITLHALNTILIFALAKQLDLPRFAAWLAAALFAVHAAHPENVVWMAGGFDLIATLFVLTGLLAFLRGHHIIAIPAMILGILSKESAYAFPLIILLLCVWQRKRLIVSVPYVAVTLALLIFRLWLFLAGVGGYAGGVNVLSAANALLARLWAVLFFPINWSMPAVLIVTGLAATYAWLFTAKVPRHRLLILIAFIIAAALPAIQQLLIGADLQKSRLLYLPSIAFCLLIGFVADQRRGAGLAILLFNALALWHNLNAWDYASSKAKAACMTAARCSKPEVTGLPGSLMGVYFFANGFPECVALQNQKPTSETCSFTWDSKTASLIQTK